MAKKEKVGVRDLLARYIAGKQKIGKNIMSFKLIVKILKKIILQAIPYFIVVLFAFYFLITSVQFNQFLELKKENCELKGEKEEKQKILNDINKIINHIENFSN